MLGRLVRPERESMKRSLSCRCCCCFCTTEEKISRGLISVFSLTYLVTCLVEVEW